MNEGKEGVEGGKEKEKEEEDEQGEKEEGRIKKQRVERGGIG
jgi:hypothetical protein